MRPVEAFKFRFVVYLKSGGAEIIKPVESCLDKVHIMIGSREVVFSGRRRRLLFVKCLSSGLEIKKEAGASG